MKRAAFTFVEILVALAFIGVLLPAIVSGLRLANRASVIAERSTAAAQLAENEMADLLLDGAWSTGETRDFGADHPGYTWQLSQREWPTAAGMTELTLEVHYQVQGQDHSVNLVTLATDPTTAASSSTTGASGLPGATSVP